MQKKDFAMTYINPGTTNVLIAMKMQQVEITSFHDINQGKQLEKTWYPLVVVAMNQKPLKSYTSGI